MLKRLNVDNVESLNSSIVLIRTRRQVLMTLRLALLGAIRTNMAAGAGVVVEVDAFASSAGLGAVTKALRLTGCTIPGCKCRTLLSVMTNDFSTLLKPPDPRLQCSMVVGSRLVFLNDQPLFWRIAILGSHCNPWTTLGPWKLFAVASLLLLP